MIAAPWSGSALDLAPLQMGAARLNGAGRFETERDGTSKSRAYSKSPRRNA
jgi:hypothetical protein